MTPRIAELLNARGHPTTAAQDLGLAQAADSELLRRAGELGLILVSADDDFVQLHRVGSIAHAGILRVPQVTRERADVLSAAILELIGSNGPLENELYTWRVDSGWMREA